jgi:thymidylate synthase
VGEFVHSVVDAHVYCGQGERGEWYANNLADLQARVADVEDREEYLAVRDWLVETAPDEPAGEERYDHVPGLLEQCARTPKTRPRIEIADRPLDELGFEDIQLHEYDSEPGLRFAVAE